MNQLFFHGDEKPNEYPAWISSTASFRHVRDEDDLQELIPR